MIIKIRFLRGRNMFNPCYEHCYLRYSKQYTKECDDNCDYAKIVKENRLKDEIIWYLIDMLEDEHIGMTSVAIEEIKNEFGVEL